MIECERRASRTRNRVGRWALCLSLVVSASTLGAQARPLAPAGAGAPQMERLAALVQQRLGLTDDQARRLRESTRRFAVQREKLGRDERAARKELRDQVRARDAADQKRVGVLLDTLVQLQRRRVDMLVDEQRELAAFLTPVQRAEFLALQERAFRAAQQARLRREARGNGARGMERPFPRHGERRADSVPPRP